ncbi:steroidogenic acute regulatory protein, mitochondrial isoform X1 [Falco cherrug]|uniref:steroidogenic acute regulatory protein, mitochondrial isoform X1 n=1 Tax=Falco cherrug TaxID=345164 RepID=UPI002478E1A6|nr:steroidogenic acute regulatory protein, mitochondrial isoform X1 [Falco cherrug]
MSPAARHRGACAPQPPQPPAGGVTLPGLFWFFSQTTACPCAEALCPGAAAPSGITAVPAGPQPRGLPAAPVPRTPDRGAVGAGGGCTVPEGLTALPRHCRPVGARRVFGTSSTAGSGAPGSGSGISNPPDFSSRCPQACGDQEDEAQPPRGRAAAGTWESRLCGDFPRNHSGKGWCSFWLPPGPTSAFTQVRIANTSARCLVSHVMESSSPRDGEELSWGAAGPEQRDHSQEAADPCRGSRAVDPRSTCSGVYPQHRGHLQSPIRAQEAVPPSPALALLQELTVDRGWGLARLHRASTAYEHTSAHVRASARRMRPAAPGRCTRSQVWPWPLWPCHK